jgi:hypothetical protein
VDWTIQPHQIDLVRCGCRRDVIILASTTPRLVGGPWRPWLPSQINLRANLDYLLRRHSVAPLFVHRIAV